MTVNVYMGENTRKALIYLILLSILLYVHSKDGISDRSFKTDWIISHFVSAWLPQAVQCPYNQHNL